MDGAAFMAAWIIDHTYSVYTESGQAPIMARCRPQIHADYSELVSASSACSGIFRRRSWPN